MASLVCFRSHSTLTVAFIQRYLRSWILYHAKVHNTSIHLSVSGWNRSADFRLCVVYGRELLITQGSLEVLELLMKESYESITAAAAVIMASGPTASNITAEDAAIVSTIIPHICEIITRTRFGKCSNDSYTTAAKPSCTDIIDTILSVLQKDISNALNSPPNVNIAPASGGNAVAAAAAATAAANAAAALALFPFDSSRVTKMMSSLGRMIERDDQCRELAYSKHVARFALDAFKISGNAALLQVADKLLHQCCVDKSSSNDSSLENAGVACKPIFKPLSTDDEGIEPVLPVKYVVALLERAHGVGDEKLISRICRWLAFVVEVPDNAHALSDHCPPILLKVMSECKLTNSLLFGFISKCLCAIIAANPSSLTVRTWLAHIHLSRALQLTQDFFIVPRLALLKV